MWCSAEPTRIEGGSDPWVGTDEIINLDHHKRLNQEGLQITENNEEG
jgi:hypothetical protein